MSSELIFALACGFGALAYGIVSSSRVPNLNHRNGSIGLTPLIFKQENYHV